MSTQHRCARSPPTPTHTHTHTDTHTHHLDKALAHAVLHRAPANLRAMRRLTMNPVVTCRSTQALSPSAHRALPAHVCMRVFFNGPTDRGLTRGCVSCVVTRSPTRATSLQACAPSAHGTIRTYRHAGESTSCVSWATPWIRCVCVRVCPCLCVYVCVSLCMYVCIYVRAQAALPY